MTRLYVMVWNGTTTKGYAILFNLAYFFSNIYVQFVLGDKKVISSVQKCLMTHNVIQFSQILQLIIILVAF